MIEILILISLFPVVSCFFLLNWVMKLNIEVKSLKNSTHSIQYVPIDKESAFQDLTDKEKESLKASMGSEGFELSL